VHRRINAICYSNCSLVRFRPLRPQNWTNFKQKESKRNSLETQMPKDFKTHCLTIVTQQKCIEFNHQFSFVNASDVQMHSLLEKLWETLHWSSEVESTVLSHEVRTVFAEVSEACGYIFGWQDAENFLYSLVLPWIKVIIFLGKVGVLHIC